MNRYLNKHEQIAIFSLLLVAALFTAFDIFEDLAEGVSLYHVVPEISVAFGITGIAFYLLFKMFRQRSLRIQFILKQLEDSENRVQILREQATGYRQGIVELITKQLNDWELTPAEQDVTFLLIKGLSIREIAQVRETSERTIRQHASEVYRKSGLAGRAQLAAYFLEDLFVPSPTDMPPQP